MNIWKSLPKPIICLAPMEGVADTYFRQTIIHAGKPDLMFTEFTSVDGLASRGYQYVASRLQFDPIEQPLIAQIWGVNPANFYQAAKMLQTMDFAGIDINMGCPDKAVVKKGGGAALINNPSLALQIIKATKRGAGNLPVSVKTRIGRMAIDTDSWIGSLLTANLDALIIHGRTEAEKSKVPTHWTEIQKAANLRNKQGVKTLIIGNGDIGSVSQAKQLVKKYGVDGAMIGRGALKNPWIFADKYKIKRGRLERLNLLKFHLNLVKNLPSNQNSLLTIRKYYKIYLKDFKGAVKMRVALLNADNWADVEFILNQA